MKVFKREDRAGFYLTVIIHLAVLIVMLSTSLGAALQKENSFVLDFSAIEEAERLQKEVEIQEAISRRLEAELGELGQAGTQSDMPRGVAVDRGSLRDDRGTDAEQLYKDAERLQNELSQGYEVPSEDYAIPSIPSEDKKESKKKEVYTGPAVVSYSLEGRKASHLDIPAYRCYGAGQVTVIITVNPQGMVTNAKIDDSVSSPDDCLRSYAIRAARLAKFSTKADAPAKQEGNIVYEFIAQ